MRSLAFFFFGTALALGSFAACTAKERVYPNGGTSGGGQGGAGGIPVEAGGGPSSSVTGGPGGAGGAGSTTDATSTSDATSTADSSSSAGGGGSGGGGGVDACTNAADQAVLTSKDVKALVTMCAQQNLGQEPATKNCIQTGTGLSDGCVTCFDDQVQCVVQHCFNECFNDPNSGPCTMCRAQFCDPAFMMCSGVPAG